MVRHVALQGLLLAVWSILVTALIGAPIAPLAFDGAVPTAFAQSAPVVDGQALETTTVAGWPVHYDREVPADAVAVATDALESALRDVPRMTGLPPFSTPLAVYLLADDSRFRAALAEIGRVRIDLVALEVGGYAIERDGTMLIFFQGVGEPLAATIGFAHELAHLGVREASARRPVPQWLNEGYAQWVAYAVLGERDPLEAEEQFAADRAVVASALHGESSLLPWSSLVTRTRFSRTGTEGWGNLAYGQSTLFVDWLARRHGVGALASFLQGIGAGAGATAAFQAVFGPFPPEEAAFQASLAPCARNSGRACVASRRRPGPVAPCATA